VGRGAQEENLFASLIEKSGIASKAENTIYHQGFDLANQTY